MTEENPGVLAEMAGVTWTDEQATAYQAAIDAINTVVQSYTNLIAREEAGGDAARLAELNAARDTAIAARRELRTDDPAAIDAARQRYDALAGQLAREMP